MPTPEEEVLSALEDIGVKSTGVTPETRLKGVCEEPGFGLTLMHKLGFPAYKLVCDSRLTEGGAELVMDVGRYCGNIRRAVELIRADDVYSILTVEDLTNLVRFNRQAEPVLV